MKKTITDYFDETVNRFPDRVAVTDRNRTVTYRELQAMAKNAAAALCRESLSEKPIALLFPQGADLTVAMLAVLYTNHFYTVLDYDSPKERQTRILETLKPAAVLCGDLPESMREAYEQDGIRLISLPKNSRMPDKAVEEILSRETTGMTGESPAYALFTSGSTGMPKGVLVTHNNVIAYIRWFTECFGITEQTSFGAQTPLHFSMSVSDFFGSMFTGAAYHLIPKELFALPAHLVDYLNEKQINTVYWVPSALGIVFRWDLFRYGTPAFLRTVLFAGEAMPGKYLRYWREYLPEAAFANLFGPTETTDICTYYKVDRDFADGDSIPIGGACENCELFVVDPETGKAAEKGQTGELYVKGPFVAKGYYRNSQKTDEAFVQHPFHNDYPDPVYKTGDLVRFNERGELLSLGRKDFQIKHMGYRIELGEIEAVFNAFTERMMTVCLYEEDRDRLVLVYASDSERGSELSEYAAERLPIYMRPERYERMDGLPVNPNGKIDRKAIRRKLEEEESSGTPGKPKDPKREQE